MYVGTMLMIFGGVGLAVCLIWIAVDSAGRGRRQRGYAEQAARAVHAVPAPSGPMTHTSAVLSQTTARAYRPPTTGHAPASTGFCPACGTPLGAGAAFCRNCGRAVPRGR